MDTMCVSEELSGMLDVEQMLIARLTPTLHAYTCLNMDVLSLVGITLHFLGLCKDQQILFHTNQQKWISYV